MISGQHPPGGASFDTARFAAAIRAMVTQRRLSDRQTAAIVGVSPSTISRVVRHDAMPDVLSLAKLANWAGLSVDAFVVRTVPVPRNSTVDAQRRTVAALHAAEAAHRALALLLEPPEEQPDDQHLALVERGVR